MTGCRGIPRLSMLFPLLACGTVAGCAGQPATPQMPPMEVRVQKPLSKKMIDWDEYLGDVTSPKTVNVQARVRGHVKAVKFTEGEEVKEGQVLLVLDSELFKAELQQAKGLKQKWEAQKERAEKDIERYEKALLEGAATSKELDDARIEKKDAKAGILTALGQIKATKQNIEYCTINAEIDGKIGKALVTEGNLVDPATGNNLLTKIVPMDPIYVEFYVNERALLNYKNIFKEKGLAPAEAMEVQVARATDEGFPIKGGKIDFIDNEVDPSTGSILVRAKFDNPQDQLGLRPLTPGLVVKVRISATGAFDAILIPDQAILSDQSLKYVLVVDKKKDNVVERIDVELGRLTEDGMRVIRKGLSGDEWVIVLGMQRVIPGMKAVPIEAKKTAQK